MDYSRVGTERKKRRQGSQTTRIRNKVGLIMLRITLAVVLISGFAIMGAGIGIYVGILNHAPDLNFEVVESINQATVIFDYNTGEELDRLHAGQNHETVTIDQIPMHVRHAFISIEDERFFEHNGVDMRSMGRAAHSVLTGGRIQGASTITQQLVKNMLERFDADIVTKLQEQYLAIRLEQQLTEDFGGDRMAAKDFILEAYLNIINLGRANIGIQAAAWFYYGVDVSELTIAQAATIAAVTQNPSRFPPDTRPADNWVRAQLVLGNMLRLGHITQAEYNEAMREVTLEDGTRIGAVYNSIFRIDGGGTRHIVAQFDDFTDALITAVRNDLMNEFGLTSSQANAQIYGGGLQIFSTQNHELQAIVDRVFLDDSYWPEHEFSIDINYSMTVLNTITQQRRHYGRERTVRNTEEVEAFIYQLQNELLTYHDVVETEVINLTPQPQSAFVLLDHHTGHVVALRGVRGERPAGNLMFNRATQATRSPGSQMKPIAPFAPAFDLGIMQPATVIDDVPFTLLQTGSPPWTPSNWWGGNFEGLSTARRAIYRSMNVVSARAGVDPTIPHVGVPTMIAYLQRLGITTLVETGPNADLGGAFILGGMAQGVHLIELAGAYGAIANMGEFNRPVLYSMVLDHNGNVLLDNRNQPERVLRDTTAYLLIDTMRDTMRASGATGHAINFTDADLRRNIPISGKTGTSQDNRDLGFSGFTPYFTASIWMGNDSNARMSSRASGTHLIPWRVIMQEVHAHLEPRQFVRPSGIVTAAVCLDSGHLATELCRQDPRGNRSRTEIFAAMHVPTQECTVHQQFTYCHEHGYLASINCPPWSVHTRIGLVRPQPIIDFTVNIADRHMEFPQGVLDGLVCPYHGAGSVWGWPQWPGVDSEGNPIDSGQIPPGLGDIGNELPTGMGPPAGQFPPTNQLPPFNHFPPQNDSNTNLGGEEQIPPANTVPPPPSDIFIPLPPAEQTPPANQPPGADTGDNGDSGFGDIISLLDDLPPGSN